MPSLLAIQLIISLTGQEAQAKQKEASNPEGFILQMQSTALQDKTMSAPDKHETVANSFDPSEMDITV